MNNMETYIHNVQNRKHTVKANDTTVKYNIRHIFLIRGQYYILFLNCNIPEEKYQNKPVHLITEKRPIRPDKQIRRLTRIYMISAK